MAVPLIDKKTNSKFWMEEQGKIFPPTKYCSDFKAALELSDKQRKLGIIYPSRKNILSQMKKLDKLIRSITGCSKNWPDCVRRQEVETTRWRSLLLHLFRCTTVPSTGKRSSKELKKKIWLYFLICFNSVSSWKAMWNI